MADAGPREPVPEIPLCPWHNTRNCVEETTRFERDRTGHGWWCNQPPRALFRGTASEYQRIRAEVLAAEAEHMTTTPQGKN